MPHYFIDTDDDEQLVVDDVGHELHDAAAARRLALASLPDMASDRIPNGDRRTLSASVRDERGVVLYRATLSLVGEWLVGPGRGPIEPEPGAAAAEPSPR
ncbi:DUF6894 family protein [Methylobacterium sp. sgz302541]|uniref:DUF6894 family protein n=1 Tax=unclassified Methylobacterium TaxID=2615210 RepID=UPI003D33A991